MLEKLTNILAILAVLLITSCEPKDKFDWNAGMSAPLYYGATGPFVEYFYKGKSIAGTSSNVGIAPGWGITSGGYVGGNKFKDVPDSIAVTWVCDVDRYLYQGGFRLPREEMIKLFQKGKVNSHGEKNEYSQIVTGMAPGGNVTVWLKGGGENTKVFSTKVKENGIWMENDKDYNKYIKKHRAISEGYYTTNIFRNLHGVPYKVWEKNDAMYNYDIGFGNEEDRDFSIIITPISKDGSYVFFNQDEFRFSNKELLQNTINFAPKKEKLPIQVSVQWVSKDYEQWYEGEVVMPEDFQNIFKIFSEKNKKNSIIFMMDKINESENYCYGNLWLYSPKEKQKIMKFRLSKLDVISREFYVSKYSLPKGFVFPKWEGREPIVLPKDFQYYQEK